LKLDYRGKNNSQEIKNLSKGTLVLILPNFIMGSFEKKLTEVECEIWMLNQK
jgi:hypothetical protein